MQNYIKNLNCTNIINEYAKIIYEYAVFFMKDNRHDIIKSKKLLRFSLLHRRVYYVFLRTSSDSPQRSFPKTVYT